MKDGFKLALCQMNVVDNKDLNVTKAVNMIMDAACHADMVVLPEMFNCPYDNSKFREYAESAENSMTLHKISQAAEKAGVYVVAGSIPEVENSKIYNSSFIFRGDGEVIGVHRKLHLFDIDVPGKIAFKESETLTAGNGITVVDTEFCRVGVAICYDVRFPELSRLMTNMGAELVVVPGAFNMTTGPAHWEVLMRARAVDNQVYVAAASPARNENSSYVAYGNSMIVDPWGNTLKRADADETIIYANVDLSKVKDVRDELPLLKNRRKDLYEVSKMWKP